MNDIKTNEYTTVNGESADLGKFEALLKQMGELAVMLADAAPVEQFGQVERAELIQELVACSQAEFREDTQVVYSLQAA